MGLYAVDSVSSTPIIQRSAFGNYSDTAIITFGFACCLFSGLTRSFGMTMYRQIKSEVDPITVVFIHAVLTCFAALPVMRTFECIPRHILIMLFLVIFQKPTIPDSTETWLYLGGACITASVATFSSNAAIQYINPGLASVAQNTDLIGAI